MRRILSLLALLLPLALSATPPSIITYHGTIVDPGTGKPPPPTTPINLTFRLYAGEEGGSALWGRTTPVKVSDEGEFYVELSDGTGDAVPSASFRDLDQALAQVPEGLWLSLAAYDGAETKRVRIAPVPHAVRARVASDASTLEAKEVGTEILAVKESASVKRLRSKSLTIKSDGASSLRTANRVDGVVQVSGVFHLDEMLGGPGFAVRIGEPGGKAASDSIVLRKCEIRGVGWTYASLLFPGGSSYGGCGETVSTTSLGAR